MQNFSQVCGGPLNLELVNTFGTLTTDFFCSCDAVEEDYTAYDRLARKLGFKYVMSCLPVGSLVWAQSTGYCRYIFGQYFISLYELFHLEYKGYRGVI